jgi:hypothetical protein
MVSGGEPHRDEWHHQLIQGFMTDYEKQTSKKTPQ